MVLVKSNFSYLTPCSSHSWCSPLPSNTQGCGWALGVLNYRTAGFALNMKMSDVTNGLHAEKRRLWGTSCMERWQPERARCKLSKNTYKCSLNKNDCGVAPLKTCSRQSKRFISDQSLLWRGGLVPQKALGGIVNHLISWGWTGLWIHDMPSVCLWIMH